MAAIAIHGRTRKQGFSGLVNREGIRAVVEAVRSIPVVGNGDVRTIPDADRMLAETGCQAVSIGRGALANPWIFSQLVQWEQTGHYDPPGSFDDRLQLLARQFQYVIELRGRTGRSPFSARWATGTSRPCTSRRSCGTSSSSRKRRRNSMWCWPGSPNAAHRSAAVRASFPIFHIPVPSGPVPPFFVLGPRGVVGPALDCSRIRENSVGWPSDPNSHEFGYMLDSSVFCTLEALALAET